ncbi:putative nucleotidyltransferase substrate binding domain-containing protein [Rhodoferax sp.]|uniref:putative nucleotidyltransferase substrate binding domain-containing protein n=1 Tax=Rhodoferax sp. TaxID=50421 RepID=UPI00285175EF|nr:putative nucleotidyltransferase substrate binding domain-containing protein [Rhodoferax sp.]MDR3370103.1 putative nucleotidyltransferase substrate binding domain-containing protein [Rhodoferax sp.]
MADVFSFDFSPFDALCPTERTLLADSAVCVHRSAGQALDLAESATDHLWVVQRGHVQRDEDGHVHVLGAGECTGWRALLTGRHPATTTALDEVMAWQLPKDILLRLLADNARFSALVFAEVARHLISDSDADQNREMMSLMLVRVKDAYLQKPLYVDGQQDLVSVCRILSEKKMTQALVRDMLEGHERIGMFTTTDLRDAILKPIAPNALLARDVARFDLITLPPDAELFDALLIMLRHRVHRILIKDGDTILGILSQLDLMSFMSTHSHLITLQVEHAQTVDELRTAALQVDDAIKLLQRAGLRIEIISRLVSELNSQIFARLWSLVAPAELVHNSCLLVLGSEGRSEQILKTDQDNALLLRDGFEHPSLGQATQQFSAALLTFGYPPCPGNIMITNPQWCQNLGAFRETIGQWLFAGEAEGTMNLAIFLDARAVCGDASLLANAREHALNLAIGSNTYVGRMASAINQFSEPTVGWWSRITKLQANEPETFDLKKIGTFPIVHGARALALEHRLEALSTTERLQALSSLEALPAALARDLIETLHLLMGLKLRNNLRQRSLGDPISNLVQLNSLGTLDRDLLKDALAIIRQFRQHLRLHYRLEA